VGVADVRALAGAVYTRIKLIMKKTSIQTGYSPPPPKTNIIYVIYRIRAILLGWVRYMIFRPKRYFFLKGEKYRQFYHQYNMTWENERCVEIPIVWKEINRSQSKRILELGNVISHYLPFDHDIIDKYEKCKGVINQDIVDFHSINKYDLIVSISTLEHIGWDEVPKDRMKVLRAIEALKSLLSENGRIIITLPIGYNTDMDSLIREGVLHFDEQYCLRRSGYDTWVEDNYDNVQNVKYNDPFRCANGLIIATIYANRDLYGNT
jgi:hypothetical protein